MSSALVPLFFLSAVLYLVALVAGASVQLKADSKQDTYKLLDNVLTGGKGTAAETPDCAHKSFGPHIKQQFDKELKRDVFAFFIHVTPDIADDCKRSDKQRLEIKTYGPSPTYLKALEGEKVVYSWNFKLASGFKPSSSFTHIHQIKAVGGEDGSPLITLSPRLASPEKLQLIYGTPDDKFEELGNADLSGFKGKWVHALEKITFGGIGKSNYAITLSNVADGKELFKFSTKELDLWRDGFEFVRPKWGIYRSLSKKDQLRDEVVLFDSFCLAKGSDTCS